MNLGKMSSMLVALVAWATVALQVFITSSEAVEGALVGDLVTLFSYFSLLTNLGIALFMTYATFNPDGFANRASWRAAIALYITIVALVFHIVLAPTMTFEGLRVYTNIGLHSAVPALYLIDWAFFAPKASLHIKDPLKWLIFPFLYCIYSMGRGAVVGWYPYFFLDPVKLGYGSVMLNILGLVILFYIIGLMIFWLGKRLPWPR